MHRALFIQEVLQEILEYVADILPDVMGPDDTTIDPMALFAVNVPYMGRNENDLYTMALSCRTISEVAIRILWSRLHSMSPVLNLFLIHRSNTTRARMRFIYYTKFVREVLCRVSGCSEPSVDAYPNLLDDQLSAMAEVFPNLRSRRPDLPRIHELILMLWMPSLKSLWHRRVGDHNTFWQGFDGLSNYMKELSSAAPRLRQVSISNLMVLPPPEPFALLRDLHSLHLKISSSPTDQSLGILKFMKCVIADCHNLRTLGIHYERVECLVESCEPGFIHVKSIVLFLEDLSIPFIAGIFDAFAITTSVEQLDIIQSGLIRIINPEAHGQYLFGAAMDRWNSTLRRISVHLEYSIHEPITMAWIRPLLRARCLQDVFFSVRAWSSLTDGDIEELACAWPDLRLLALRFLRSPLVVHHLLPTCLTQRSLISLARSCPHLSDLAIPVQLLEIAKDTLPPIRASPTPPEHFVLTLYIVYRQAEEELMEPPDAARMLLRLFPTLTENPWTEEVVGANLTCRLFG